VKCFRLKSNKCNKIKIKILLGKAWKLDKWGKSLKRFRSLTLCSSFNKMLLKRVIKKKRKRNKISIKMRFREQYSEQENSNKTRNKKISFSSKPKLFSLIPKKRFGNFNQICNKEKV
jgi:hypothetical protein